MRTRRLTVLVVMLFVSACGSKTNQATPIAPTPPPPAPPAPPANRNPTITSVTISPVFGIDGLTQFAFASVASDPDGDTLTYEWRFASGRLFDDRPAFTTQLIGSTSNGFQNLTVSDGRGGTATATSNRFVLASMTGLWALTAPSFPGDVLAYMALAQDPSGAITGEVTQGGRSIGPPSRIESSGRVEVRFKLRGGADVTVVGQMQQSGDEVVGTFTNTSATYDGKSIRGRSAVLRLEQQTIAVAGASEPR